MRQMARIMTMAAAVVVAAPLAPVFTNGAGTAAASDSTFVPFAQIMRRCDYSETDYNGPTGFARPTAVVRSNGSEVTADVQIATAIPNIRYDVRLIQTPRPSSEPCLAGDPGVAAGALHTNAVGAGATTLTGAIEPGATGAWLFISRPDPFSQNPAEFYTTDLIVDI